MEKDAATQPRCFEILIVTPARERFVGFADALAREGRARVQWAASGAGAQAAVSAAPPHLAVIDETVGDMSGLDLVRWITITNALINTALVSSLPENAFHEASEGLGVLARLPAAPGRHDADVLLGRLAGCVLLP